MRKKQVFASLHDCELLRFCISHSHGNGGVNFEAKCELSPKLNNILPVHHINYQMLRGVRVPPTSPSNFWLPWAIQLILFESARNILPSSGKVLRNSSLRFKERYFEKAFYSTTTCSSRCSSDCTCMKILFLVGSSCRVVTYTHKHLGSVGQLWSFEKYFKNRGFIVRPDVPYRGFCRSKWANCSNSM